MASRKQINRRGFCAASLGAAVLAGRTGRALGFESANARPRIGVVGCGVRWDKRVFDPNGTYGVGKEFPKFGDIATVCDPSVP